MKEQIKKIIEYIIKNDDYLVVSHVNPDGDNIGSSLSMYSFLKKINKKVRYAMDDPYPKSLEFLYLDNVVEKSEDIKSDSFSSLNIIALDSGDRNRICLDKEIIKNYSISVNIDHHKSNENYGKINYVDSTESSTSELVYNLIKCFEEMENKKIIDGDIATYLYTGLVTDTGNFQYSNTKPSSFLMAYDLSNRGAKKDTIIQNIYQKNSVDYYRILGEVLNNIEIVEGDISVAVVSYDMMKKYSIGYDEIDPITPYTRDIDGVELGIFIKEKNPNEIKVSLRSKNYIDCTKIAERFGGGGHMRASGLTIKDKSIEEAKKELIRVAIEIKNDL